MSELFGHQEIGLPCPACGHETKKTFGWIKSHNEFICPCGMTVKLDREQMLRDIAPLEDAWRKLEQTIKNFGN